MKTIICYILLTFLFEQSLAQSNSESFQSLSTPSAQEYLRRFPFSPIESLIQLRIENIGCSGSIVSGEGHVLTALHCLRNCLIKAGTLSSKHGLPANFIDKARTYQYTECENSANIPSQKIKIEYLPANGWIFLKEWIHLSKSRQNEFMRDGLNADGLSLDFAVIRVIGHKGRSCVKVNPKLPQGSEVGWSLSYPLTKKGEPQFSIGHFLAQDLSFPSEEHLYSATVDAETGSSGSGILDANGYLRGLTIRVDKRGFSYEYGSTKFISLASILNRVLADVGELRMKSVFNCPY